MRILIQQNYNAIASWTANYICKTITDHNTHNPHVPFVLGLPTGGTIEGVYKQLVALHKNNNLSFKNVITFNMDEYVGLNPDHPQSYAYFMYNNLFNHIDIPKAHINLPDGMSKDINASIQSYEKKISSVGGIDLFVGGLGGNGHLAFNEPYSSLGSHTREKTLSEKTIQDNSRYFDTPDQVPHTAITVGVQTVMNARTVMLLVSGKSKAYAFHKIIEKGVSHRYPASILQMHRNAMIVCDEDSTDNLMVKTYKYFKNLEQ